MYNSLCVCGGGYICVLLCMDVLVMFSICVYVWIHKYKTRKQKLTL